LEKEDSDITDSDGDEEASHFQFQDEIGYHANGSIGRRFQ
jgi:hypothetical protein